MRLTVVDDLNVSHDVPTTGYLNFNLMKAINSMAPPRYVAGIVADKEAVAEMLDSLTVHVSSIRFRTIPVMVLES
jgi:hypothetical protein